MKKIVLLVPFILFWIQPIFAQNDPREGDWGGVVDFGLSERSLILHTALDSSGALKANIDVPEYEFFGVPIKAFTFEEGELKIWLFTSTYRGVLNPEGTEIVGHLTQNKILYPLVFKREFSIQPSYQLQHPMPPYPYKEEEVSYDNLAAGITLSGTLTFPDSEGPFPAVILIAGSGPSSRDEEQLNLKFFLVLADHLTRQGMAVLRFDKRGVNQSTGVYREATTLDFASDVLAGIEYLKTRKEIGQIGLIGYSEGGVIAPMLAAQSDDVAFIVTLAAPAMNGEKIAYSQTVLSLRDAGMSDDRIAKNLSLRRQLFTIAKNEADPAIAEPYLRWAITNYLADVPKDEDGLRPFGSIFDFTESNMDILCKEFNTRWVRFFLTCEPTDFFRRVTVPTLAINGELDCQVVAHQNLPLIEWALRQAGNKNYRIVELPKLNHLFRVCKTGAMTEYKKLREGISPTLLNTLSEWLMDQGLLDRKAT